MVAPFFSGSVLAGMSQLSDNALVDSCEIFEPMKSAIPGGGNAITYGDVPDDIIACRITPVSGDAILDRIIAGRSGPPPTLWRVVMPRGTVIPGTWRLRVTTASGSIKVMKIVGEGAGYSSEIFSSVVGEEISSVTAQ